MLTLVELGGEPPRAVIEGEEWEIRALADLLYKPVKLLDLRPTEPEIRAIPEDPGP